MRELIETKEILAACEQTQQKIRPGDTVLLFTDHCRWAYGTDNWAKGSGLSADVARWLGEQQIAAFGAETVAPGVSGVSKKRCTVSVVRWVLPTTKTW